MDKDFKPDGRPRSVRRRLQEVIDVAARVFSEKSYAGSSVEDIARALHMTKGSVYHYVDSKEDLLYTIIEEMHDLTRKDLDRVRAMDAGPVERLRALFEGQIRLNALYLAKSTVIYRELPHLSAEHRRLIIKTRDEIELFARSLMSEAVRQGIVCPSIDIRRTSIYMFSAANSIYQWYKPAGAHSPDEVARGVTDFILRSIECGVDRSNCYCLRHPDRIERDSPMTGGEQS
jgi:TetR/AcrR family transcriptional regulator, cholesterol catabolism regulator